MNKIFIIRDELLNYGGAEKLFFQQINFYKNQNYEVIIFCETLSQKLNEYISTFKIINLSKINIISKILKFFYYLIIFRPKKIFFHETGFYFIWPVIKLLGFRYFIFLHDSIFWYENNQLAFTFIYKKYLKIFSRNFFYEKFIKEKKYNNFLIKFLMKVYYENKALLDFFGVKFAYKILTICDDSKKELDIIYNINSVIFYPGTNFQSSLNFLKNKKKIFFTVNRLTPRKRIDIIINSFFLYEKKNKNSILIIAGSGPSLQDYKKLANKLGLRKKIFFTGFLNESRLIKYYKNCDVVLYPQWGSWGLVPLEALYFNKRVIVTSDSGTRDLKKFFGKSVLISKPNIKNFYEQMLLSDKNDTINSHSIVRKKFTIKEYFKRIDKI